MIDNYVEVLKGVLKNYKNTLVEHNLFIEDLAEGWDKLRLAYRNKSMHKTEGGLIVTKYFVPEENWIIASRIYVNCKEVHSETKSIDTSQQQDELDIEYFVKCFFDDLFRNLPSAIQ